MAENSDIYLKIALDENKVPETIFWTAEDGGVRDEPAKAVMLSLWDARSKDTLRIDLWTKDMELDDMKRFFHQTLLSMADSYDRATDETEMAEDFRDFARYFAERQKLG
jgi:gliding motility-associated protein GldC